jgi:hypothetical protein
MEDAQRTTDSLRDELARLEHKLKHNDGSPEALRRMSRRAGDLRVQIAQRPLVVTRGTPRASDLELF